ncbi:hypothetical protein BBO_07644 [Beauveria brongniartii RCEF 3172]|uniref:HNH nuclease domain-containing protein n=1 Tax=Beauveria brongniartii RCEF 3172 TaxID=1081107 RepID=A0A166YUE2_9HYPO|nr:hypothetical protein BBO_07644 [Beauveria brongniartii RCEF 3172]
MTQGASSSSVEPDGLYSRAAYVETPAIPDYLTLHDNTPAVQQIRDLYAANLWHFTKWHLALFYMSSKEDLAEWVRNPEAAREYGDTAQLFGILFTARRIPSLYKLPVDPAPPASAAVNLAPPSASITFDVPPGSSKTRHADQTIRDSLKRRSSVSSVTGTLKKKVTHLMKRSEIFQSWRQPSSSSEDFSPGPSTNTETEPSALTAPLDKGKRPMTRPAAAAAARVPHDTNKTSIAQIGEAARHKGSHGQLPATMHSSLVPPATHKRRRLGNETEERDCRECVVTRKGKAVDGAHIVPFAVNSTQAGLDYLPRALAIAERLLGKSLGQVRRVLCTLGGTDYHWNVITLTPYLHRLWNSYGLIGFRPRYIDAEQDKSGNVHYLATFTFHWLFKNNMNSSLPVPEQLSAHDCLLMVTESGKFSTEKDRIFETVYTPGRQPPNDLQRLEDGHICRVKFSDRKEAELMMVMLDLRWHASRLLCLSGAAGEDLLEPASDGDSDSDVCSNYGCPSFGARYFWGSDYDESA